MEENSGLLTPILEKNMESWVKKAVSEYCELHFNQIAKRAIQTELEGLLSEKERLLKETIKPLPFLSASASYEIS